MRRTVVTAVAVPAAIAALVLPTQTWASNGSTISAEEAGQLWTKLEGLGYAVRMIDHEGDKIEVEAYKDGVEYEIDLDPNTLEIIRERRDD